jgi:hypothetical protein
MIEARTGFEPAYDGFAIVIVGIRGSALECVAGILSEVRDGERPRKFRHVRPGRALHPALHPGAADYTQIDVRSVLTVMKFDYLRPVQCAFDTRARATSTWRDFTVCLVQETMDRAWRALEASMDARLRARSKSTHRASTGSTRVRRP